ncbi:chemotaxis protein [Streptomyces sp. HUCO-GS316]|nr:chemotaxis protein [Streptomyces sp. HUCO-GS316]
MRRNIMLWQAITATVLTGGLVAGYVGLTPASAAGTNLALGKTVTASSTEGAGFEPTKAVDGSTSTRWASLEGVDNQWIQIDLGSVTDVGQVVLKWEAAYAKSYRVEVSDDASTWRQVYSTTTGDGGTDNLTVTGSGRYLRVYGTQRATAYGYSLYEVEVYGGSATSPSPTTPPDSTTNLLAGRPTSVSSVEGAGFEGGKAVDGSTSTRWASAEGVDPQWLRVDMGSTKTVGRVVLKWEAAYAKSYRVELSDDGSTWRQVYSTTTGDGGTDDLTVSGSGRYLRVYGTQRATAYGYSLYEVEAYGSGSTTSPSPTTPPPSSTANLDDPYKKENAMKLVSSFENSSLDWRAQFAYIEDIGDGRGYTAGIIGFCSGTGDMLDLVERYTQKKPSNPLAPYLPALREVNGTDSHDGLGTSFENAWRTAAQDSVFTKTQEEERDRVYFNPAVGQAKTDGLKALGQFAYYDAAVMHGEEGFRAIRSRAASRVRPPSQGGNEVTFLHAFLDEREEEMRKEEAHSDTTRVSTAQRRFLNEGNLHLDPPLYWSVYGDSYSITS